MNYTAMTGRLTANPEMRFSKDKTPYCTFRLAVARESNRKVTDFFSCIAWRDTAELCQKYLYKGRQCLIRGEMQTYNYTAQDGSARSGVRMYVNRVEFFSDGGAAHEAPPMDEGAPDMSGFMPVDDDGLPF